MSGPCVPAAARESAAEGRRRKRGRFRSAGEAAAGGYELERDAVHGLLRTGAEVIDGEGVPLTAVLETGAECECEAEGLPPEVAAWWVEREAAYRIAHVCGFSPGGRDDPAVAMVIAALARAPTSVQSRVLRGAARRV